MHARLAAPAAALALVIAAGLLGGCAGASTPGAPSDAPGAPSPGPSAGASDATTVPVVVGGVAPTQAPSTASTKPLPTATATDAAQALLARHGLAGKGVEEVIAALEASADKRPLALKAVVKPAVLELSDGAGAGQLPLPPDKFYLAVAPFRTGNPECTYHNLSADLAELRGQKVHVVINDANNSPLVDADVTLGANGFAGFWLPRDRHGLITITQGELAGQTDYSTRSTGATCRTQIRLK